MQSFAIILKIIAIGKTVNLSFLLRLYLAKMARELNNL